MSNLTRLCYTERKKRPAVRQPLADKACIYPITIDVVADEVPLTSMGPIQRKEMIVNLVLGFQVLFVGSKTNHLWQVSSHTLG